MTNENTRQLVIPGEVISEGDDLLPGEGTRKEDGKIIASRYGLSDFNENLIKKMVSIVVYPKTQLPNQQH